MKEKIIENNTESKKQKNHFFDSEIIENDMLEILFDINIKWDYFKGSTILITGATGMIASYIVFLFLYLNEYYDFNLKLVLIVRNVSKAKSILKEYFYKDYVTILENNLTSEIEFKGDVNYIFHAASYASPQHYTTHPVDVIIPNTIGTHILLNFAKQKKVKSFLFFSTGDIYGKITGVKTVTEKTIGKLDPLDIHSCYGESKRLAETLCKAYYIQHNVPIKIARIFHTYSPTMDIYTDPRIFSSLMKSIINNEDITLFSDGKGMRSFCYITDAIRGYLTILLDGVNGEAYNVCNTDEYMSILEFATINCSVANKSNLEVRFKKRELADNYLENLLIKNIKPNNRKLKILKWNTKVTTLQGVERVYNHIKKTKNVML